MRSCIERAVLSAWYGPWPWTFVLWPFEWLYRQIVARKSNQAKPQAPLAVPVIVVGNLVVGGAGKTPLTLALAQALCDQGYKPGIVSRGYGGNCQQFPRLVQAGDAAILVGDEPRLMANRGFQVCIDPQRRRGAQALIDSGCDVLLCDDGLQHYALPRDIEIAVFDAARMVGNGHCLPVGPLREPLSRLQRVDFTVLNGDAKSTMPTLLAEHAQRSSLSLQPLAFVNVRNGERLAISEFTSLHNTQTVYALSGIANTARFFKTLEALGLTIGNSRSFADHHAFTADDLPECEGVLLMTEKDAVKCAAFAPPNAWYLEVAFCLPPTLIEPLLKQVKQIASLRDSQPPVVSKENTPP